MQNHCCVRFLRLLCISIFLLSFHCSYAQTYEEQDFAADSVEIDSLIASQDVSIIHQSIVDRVMQRFEFNRGRISAKTYPSIGFDPASGLAVGVLSLVVVEPKDKENKKLKFNRPTSISTLASYSTKNWVNLKSDMVIYASHGVMINTLVQYQVSPDNFYGIGNDTLNTNPLSFNMKDFQWTGNVSKELSSTCYFGFMFDLSYRNATSSDTTKEGLSLPEARKCVLLGFGPHFTFDRRDDVNYPTHGECVTIGLKYFAPYNERAYSFYSVEINARKYMRLYKDLILATQFFSGTSEGEMPFYSLYQLGGMTRMRGISNKYIYIDKCVYYAQCELRKHLFSRFGAVVFGGIGNTFDKLSDFTTKHMRYVYGAGLRFQSDVKNNISLRLDYGRSNEGNSGLYMTMREAF